MNHSENICLRALWNNADGLGKPEPDFYAYAWKYGDGTWAYGLYETAAGKFSKVHLNGNKKQLEAWKSIQKANPLCKFKKIELENRVGLKAFKAPEPVYQPPKLIRGAQHSASEQSVRNREYLSEMDRYLLTEEMLSAGKQLSDGAVHYRMLLMAALLSGCMIRSVRHSDVCEIPQERVSAPMVRVSKKKKAAVEDFLASAARSFCVDTTENGEPYPKDGLFFTNPPYFPYKAGSPNELQNAYLTGENGKKEEMRFYTVYRDTSVVIDVDILGPKNALKFVNRNPMCSTVMLGKCPQVIKGVIPIGGNDLMPDRMAWDEKKLQEMSRRFVLWVACWYRGKKKWAKKTVEAAKECLNTYSGQRKKINYADRYYWLILLTTAMALADFLRSIGELDESAYEYHRGLWLNLLLPGCCTMPQPSREDQSKEMLAFTDEDYLTLFRTKLQRAFTSDILDRCIYVPGGKKIGEVLPDGTAERQIAGYFRDYQAKGTEARRVLAIEKERLEDWFGENADQLIEAVYTHTPYALNRDKTLSARFLGKNSVRFFVILVDTLDFLDEATVEALNAKFN